MTGYLIAAVAVLVLICGLLIKWLAATSKRAKEAEQKIEMFEVNAEKLKIHRVSDGHITQKEKKIMETIDQAAGDDGVTDVANSFIDMFNNGL